MGPGRNADDNRAFINGVLWIARTRAPWEDLPKRYGKPNTVFQRSGRWSKKGRWQAIFEALQDPDPEWLMLDSTTVRAHQHAAGQRRSDPDAEALGRSRGGFSTKIHALVDALGNPLTFNLTPGQAGDCPQAEPLLAFCGGEEQKKAVEFVLGDKGYDSKDLAEHIEEEFEAEAVIPSRKNAKEPREIDRELYKDRNKIERFIGRVKHYRRVATRYGRPRATTCRFCRWRRS